MITRDVENWMVEKLDKERDQISFPEYQREKSLWTDEKKGLLIDSILRDFDIPKLYFNRLKDETIEVIDGQQRLWSIWEFLDDEFECRIDGKSHLFSGLTPTQRERIRKYKFQVTVFDEADDDYLRDLFLRLQWGLLLNTGEKLHATQGKMKQFVFSTFVGHPLVKNLGIPKRRYAKQTLCAQITINFFSKKKNEIFSRTRYEDLIHFFSEYEEPRGKDLQTFQQTTKRILQISDQLWETFDSDGKLLRKALRSRSYILSVFLFFDALIAEHGELSSKAKKEFADFVFKLAKRVREESRLGIDRKNRELYSFDTMLNSAPGERYQIERRHEKLGEYYEYFQKFERIKGDRKKAGQ
jgi:hypothetical protein